MPKLTTGLWCLLLASTTVACAVTDDEPVVVTQFAVAAADRTLVSSCSPNELLAQPTELDLSCAPVPMYLHSLTWEKWGQTTATATGAATLYADCAGADCDRLATDNHITVRVTAGNLLKHHAQVAGAPLVSQYATLRIVFNGELPAKTPRETTFEVPQRITTGLELNPES